MEKISGIYKIINKVNGKYYVGSSKNIKRRFYIHKYCLNKNDHVNDHLQYAWNKYGADSFEFLILESNIPSDQLDIVEQKYLDVIEIKREESYNISLIAGKVEMSDATRKKMSMSHMGEKNHNFGNHKTEETRKKISIANTGKIHSEEARRKISQSNMGHLVSEETRRKISKKNAISQLGKKRSEETKEKKRQQTAGKKNPAFDPSIFHFYNKIMNETFIGTKYDFKRKYSIISHVHDLANGKRDIVRGWIIIR